MYVVVFELYVYGVVGLVGCCLSIVLFLFIVPEYGHDDLANMEACLQ